MSITGDVRGSVNAEFVSEFSFAVRLGGCPSRVLRLYSPLFRAIHGNG